MEIHFFFFRIAWTRRSHSDNSVSNGGNGTVNENLWNDQELIEISQVRVQCNFPPFPPTSKTHSTDTEPRWSPSKYMTHGPSIPINMTREKNEANTFQSITSDKFR